MLAARVVEGVSPEDPVHHVPLDPTPASSGIARRFVVQHCRALFAGGGDADGGDADGADVLALLTSELVTNGVLHARTALVLGVAIAPACVLVTVSDDNRQPPVLPPPDDDRPSGRGLLLLTALAAQWGVFDRDGGKTVWFTLPRVGAAKARSGVG